MAVRVRFPLRVQNLNAMEELRTLQIAAQTYRKLYTQGVQQLNLLLEDTLRAEGKYSFEDAKEKLGDRQLFLRRNINDKIKLVEVTLDSPFTGDNASMRVNVRNVKTKTVIAVYKKDLTDKDGNFLFR